MIGLYILCAVVALLGIYNLWNNTFCYSQYKAFNENIKNWSVEFDKNINRMIWLAADKLINETKQEEDEKVDEKESSGEDSREG